MTLFDLLVQVAIVTFVVGWLIVIADAISGFRLIEKLPSRVTEAFSVLHNAAWGGILLVGLAAYVLWIADH